MAKTASGEGVRVALNDRQQITRNLTVWPRPTKGILVAFITVMN